MPIPLVGREAERSRIAGVLDGARDSRGGALVLRGEPGAGKSALLEDTRERARDMDVLGSRGIEWEAELPFAGLHQLVRPALSHLDALPGPQARSLRAALGLEENGGGEPFLASLAVLSLLSEASAQRPLLCLVDDAHWLDDASAEALVFVARRIGAERVALLFATREGEIRGFDPPALPKLSVGGLGASGSPREPGAIRWPFSSSPWC